MGNLAKSVGRMALNLAKTVASIAAVATAAAVGLLASTIKPASDLNETISKTGVVFGSATDEVMKFADGAATAVGMSKQAALDAASVWRLR